MNKITIAILSFIAAIFILSASGYFVYTYIQTQRQVTQNTIAISQIVDFLNKATQPPVTK